MIAIVVLFLVGSEPVGAPLRSHTTFATLADCEAVLQTERHRFDDLARRLTAETGRPIHYRAACLDLTPGAAA